MWTDLPKLDSKGQEITYTVKEIPISGFESSVTEGGSGGTKRSWEAVTTLETGKTYLLVSENGALSTNSSGLIWTDVSINLAEGTMPGNAAVWIYNGQLKNGDGKYIKTSSSYNSSSFTAGTSGSDITFSNGYISASISGRTRYFGSITNGKASAESRNSNAVDFKAYVLNETTDDRGDKHFIVTNTEKEQDFELPETGGFGKAPMIMVGVVLFLAVSVFLLYGEEIKEFVNWKRR